ncbi:uncharacterized protein LOC112904909 [Agrilus planipennis]|uniref:Uncharacterized protein LOC112904909 n=1 Tax=Agrilus planipennis TaxID=224129 RepID=A0A7F5R7J2_AGRPL|nr:uncharacterized protein LOC112904909 [Agrilus planipennis]
MELDEGFEIPKKTRKLTYDQRTATNVTTSNSFEVLHCESTDQPKIPPVIIHYNEDWNQIRKKLQLNNDTTLHRRRPQQALLDRIDCYYYTYTCDRKRPIKYVMKGIPTSLSCDDVSNDLEGKGISDTTVHRMKSRSKEIPLVLIIAPKEIGEKIKGIKTCCHLRVSIEMYRKLRRPTQCHRCQRIGHVQRNCKMAPRCLPGLQGLHDEDTKDTKAYQLNQGHRVYRPTRDLICENNSGEAKNGKPFNFNRDNNNI